MALKDEWKKTGKDIGHAFKDFGKAVGTTAKVVVGKEEKTNEEGKSTLKESWKGVGKGFGTAGKDIGKSAKGTAKKVVGKEDKEDKPKEGEVIDVPSKEIEEKK